MKRSGFTCWVFLACVLDALSTTGVCQGLPSRISPPARADAVELRLWSYYGAVFAAGQGVVLPPTVLFKDEEAVTAWQSGVPVATQTLGQRSIELQAVAMEALLAAREELKPLKLKITPQDRTASRRNYADTVKLWKTRVDSGLYYWAKKGKISRKEARRIRGLTPAEQIPEILRLEDEGLYFSSNLSKSILSSAAPPGASQHLAMLALDIKEHWSSKVRAVLAKHGWFQTVPLDISHFTYLGLAEDELPAHGLQRLEKSKRAYWVPLPTGNQPSQPDSTGR